jgi:phosphate starvation-inducible PhoH-like protein
MLTRSTHSFSRKLVCSSSSLRNQKRVVKPLTDNQQKYADFLKSPSVPIVIGIGKAGSGKTLLASSQAISSFHKKEVSKILITRPAVYLDEEHGFLPGKLEDKMQPWLKPIYDCFLEYYTMDTLKALIKEELIEICPLAYIRGRTFHNAFIIADEMQNTTNNQMKTFLTRIGQNTKTSITGDLQQCDLNNGVNGLRHFLDQLALHNRRLVAQGAQEGQETIKVVEFTDHDVQRSEVVKTVLSIYDENPIDHLFLMKK